MASYFFSMTYICFLRGINLGKRRIKMPLLKSLFEELGFKNVSTYIASGNVIFETRKVDLQKLEAKIEKHLFKSLDYEVDAFVRPQDELETLIAYPAFSKAQMEQPENTQYIVFLKTVPAAADLAIFKSIETPTDKFTSNNQELYWLCGTGVAESEVWKSKFLKQLSWKTSTTRKANTVAKIIEKLRL